MSTTFLALALAGALADPATPEIPWTDIESVARTYIETEHFPSIVLGIAIGDRVEYRCFGHLTLDPGSNQPTTKTLYEIGSITKTLTGLLLADSVVRGEVTLETELRAVLPADVPVPDDEEPAINLGHLATHSSALPRMPGNFAPRNPQNPYADFDVDRLHDALPLATLTRAPGSLYEYSNLGMGLLGHVLVLRTSATDYESLLAKRILSPLALEDTHITLNAKERARLAPPYDTDLALNSNWDLNALVGAGGVRMTIEDLVKWGRAQLTTEDSKLAEAIRLSHQVQFEDAKNKVKMGLGWHISPIDALWHTGQTGGYHAYLAVMREPKVVVAAMANASSGEVDKVAEYTFTRVLGRTPPKIDPFRPVALELAALEPLVGKYQLAPLMQFAIEIERDGKKRPKGLWAQLTGQPAARVYPESATRFRYRIVDAALTFELKDGSATAVTLHQFDKDQRAPRVTK
jgi:serine-type D-Ala-D-Ala carboxypeptidase/endopeptidase